MKSSDVVDAVATHHRDSFRSGVARFNELLAERLEVPLLGIEELQRAAMPLLSFKVGELDDAATAVLSSWLDGADRSWQLFLHDYAGLDLERRLVEGAARVLCGNAEIDSRVRDLNTTVETLWTPGLVLDERTFPASDLSVFTFGMAQRSARTCSDV